MEDHQNLRYDIKKTYTLKKLYFIMYKNYIIIFIIGQAPSPRSGCQMFSMDDGRIVVYGGYYREKIKKDYDKGTILIDMYILTPES